MKSIAFSIKRIGSGDLIGFIVKRIIKAVIPLIIVILALYLIFMILIGQISV
jgi:uncharacterized membrane protein (Fun14 family)